MGVYEGFLKATGEYPVLWTGMNAVQGWRIEDVKTVARRFKMLMRVKGGSHHVFGFPFIDEAVRYEQAIITRS